MKTIIGVALTAIVATVPACTAAPPSHVANVYREQLKALGGIECPHCKEVFIAPPAAPPAPIPAPTVAASPAAPETTVAARAPSRASAGRTVPEPEPPSRAEVHEEVDEPLP